MKEKWYPYRFKTEQEFIEEFGHNWVDVIYDRCNGDGFWIHEMNELFGKPFKEMPNAVRFEIEFNTDFGFISLLDYSYMSNHMQIGIKGYMLTKNKPKAPNYRPRKIIRDI